MKRLCSFGASARIAIACLFFLFSITNYAQTGNPIIDAPDLKAAISQLKASATQDNAQKVLDFVNANSPDAPFANFGDMQAKLKADGNPVSGYIDGITINAAISSASKSPFTAVPVNAGAQGLSFGNRLIDAAGTFIAERFKQEMEIAFLEKFRDWLNDDSKTGILLRTLLPTTTKVLLQNDPYQYTTFLETLKEALNKDVNDLPVNIGAYLGTDPFNQGSKDYYFPAVLLYDNLIAIVNGQPAVATLNGITTGDNATLLAKTPATFQSITRLLAVISRTLTNPNSDPSSYQPLLNIQTTFSSLDNIKLFFGLLMLREKDELKSIQFGGKNLYELIKSYDGSKMEKVAKWIIGVDKAYIALSSKIETINDLLANGKEVPGSLVTDGLNAMTTAVNELLKFPLADFGIDGTAITKIVTDIKTVTNYIKTLTDITVNIKDKNYGLALTNVIAILTDFIKDPKAMDVIKKYGNFAVSVAKSKDKDEMLAALDAAALPVGSYRIKRNSFANISLNAYAGVAGGFQRYSSSVPADIKRTNGLLGFTAPIGIAFSWGHRKKDKDSLSGSSSTVFISALDLGAVTAFRLTHDSSETLPDLKLKNVIAPGIFYVYDIKKLPVSVGGGVQYGPQLRSIKDNNAVILPSAWSARIFVAVDIPFFSFYTRTERKNKHEDKKGNKN